ncbi:hypothetical protein HNP84_009112 [Thermocatellispora tengchongensis]|uniref:Uncharacterized protein n=1 Tax=Thermocatellispora tengchongensis TaxID=1073253 RepID=A0A840PK69_9ACTN|nr:hypothetical protein [Thermocatellispora tengchongensis]MBB5139349.1 hypothetical protein [Thermocatellispora tengchongensis]
MHFTLAQSTAFDAVSSAVSGADFGAAAGAAWVPLRAALALSPAPTSAAAVMAPASSAAPTRRLIALPPFLTSVRPDGISP